MRTLILGAALAAVAPNVAQAETSSASASADQMEVDGREIVVTGTIYRGEVASGGARVDVPTKDLPLSISVVTEALIRDRQVHNIRDLADNVAGVRNRVPHPSDPCHALNKCS